MKEQTPEDLFLQQVMEVINKIDNSQQKMKDELDFRFKQAKLLLDLDDLLEGNNNE